MFPGGMRPLPTTSARVTQHDAQIRAAARPLKATAPTRRWTSTCQVDRQTVYGPSTSSSTAAIGALSRRMTTPSWLTLIAAAGGIAAIIDYSLIPKARMATLVAQVRLAASWLQAQARSFGGDPQGLTASVSTQSRNVPLFSQVGMTPVWFWVGGEGVGNAGDARHTTAP